MTDQTRRYSDEEFAVVLRKALELHEGGRARLPASEGLSLQDMKAVAREVGIDPLLVERAAALLPHDDLSTFDRIVGGPTRYRLEHSGSRESSKEDLAKALDVVRRETGAHGKVTSELDGITWATEGELSQFYVSLSPREGGTEVRVTVNRDGAFILTWFFSIAGSLVLSGITGSRLQPETFLGVVGLVGTFLAGGLAFARTLWTRSTRTIRNRAHRLMEILSRQVDDDPE